MRCQVDTTSQEGQKTGIDREKFDFSADFRSVQEGLGTCSGRLKAAPGDLDAAGAWLIAGASEHTHAHGTRFCLVLGEHRRRQLEAAPQYLADPGRPSRFTSIR
jgi:hypothetical protein